MLSVPLDIFYMVCPILMSNYTARNNPFIMFYKFHAVSLLCGFLGILLVAVTPTFKDTNGEFSVGYFVLYIGFMCVWYCIGSIEFLAVGAIFTNVADPEIGGTYMTFMATLTNLGHMYPSTSALYLIGFFTVKQCKQKTSSSSSTVSSVFNETASRLIQENSCANPNLSKVDKLFLIPFSIEVIKYDLLRLKNKECEIYGGVCATTRDSYYFVSIGFIILGVVWFAVFYKIIQKMSKMSKDEWKLKKI
jgi:PAT family acetyl-CoA transporter-like MFS transporter 1